MKKVQLMEPSNEYIDYLSSFTNAFGIKKTKSTTSIKGGIGLSSTYSEPCQRCKDDFVYSYVCNDNSIQSGRVKRSNSWSHIGSVVSQARTNSLVPSNVNSFSSMYDLRRRNTHPNDMSSNNCLDEYSVYASGFSMFDGEVINTRNRSVSYNFGSPTESYYKDEIVQFSYMQVHDECTARLRSNTSPPSISITNEYGSSTEVHIAVTESENCTNE